MHERICGFGVFTRVNSINIAADLTLEGLVAASATPNAGMSARNEHYVRVGDLLRPGFACDASCCDGDYASRQRPRYGSFRKSRTRLKIAPWRLVLLADASLQCFASVGIERYGVFQCFRVASATDGRSSRGPTVIVPSDPICGLTASRDQGNVAECHEIFSRSTAHGITVIGGGRQ